MNLKNNFFITSQKLFMNIKYKFIHCNCNKSFTNFNKCYRLLLQNNDYFQNSTLIFI